MSFNYIKLPPQILKHMQILDPNVKQQGKDHSKNFDHHKLQPLKNQKDHKLCSIDFGDKISKIQDQKTRNVK